MYSKILSKYEDNTEDFFESRYNHNDNYWYVFNTKTNEFLDIKHRDENVVNKYCFEMNCE